MIVRFIRPFRGYQIGSVANVADVVASDWLDFGYVVQHEEAQADADTTTKSFTIPPQDKAMHGKDVARKRGRPRVHLEDDTTTPSRSMSLSDFNGK
jgi:hypothetical protein